MRVQLKCYGTPWRTGGEVKRKLANGVGSQYPSHYLGTWCIQHYYRWCRTPRLPAVDWTDAPPLPHRFKWTCPFRRKTKFGFCACAITFRKQPTDCNSKRFQRISHQHQLLFALFVIVYLNIKIGTSLTFAGGGGVVVVVDLGWRCQYYDYVTGWVFMGSNPDSWKAFDLPRNVQTASGSILLVTGVIPWRGE